jgi:predicted dehydrogenase
MNNQNEKLGIALVGLGQYSSEELAPALLETEYCYLAGIVTGSDSKAEEWKNKYSIPESNIYNYLNFDSIANNNDIDIIYIVLPNSMHAEYVIRAAKAGKHVICEKPMAITVDECDQMIAACKEAGKQLSVGYRLHFDPYNIEMMRLGLQNVFGSIHSLEAHHGSPSGKGWRLDKNLAGGGPLMDLGIYCLQGCRYTTGMEPIAVTAKEDEKKEPGKYQGIEEGLTFELEFPNNIMAHCSCSYTGKGNILRAEAENGWFGISPAYAYRDLRGRTSEGEMQFAEVNQQAKQMDDFALCIKENRLTPVPGEMGRQDVRIMEAIYEAMYTGKKVPIH